MKFLLSSYAPIIPMEKKFQNLFSVKELTDFVFMNDYLTVSCDPSVGKYLACSLMYRGNVKKEDVTEAISELKTKKTV